MLAVAGRAASADAGPPIRELLANPGQLAAWLRDRDAVIEAAAARVEAAAALHRQTEVLPNPQLSVGASDFPIGKTTTSDDGVDRHLTLGQTTIWSVGVSELLEIGKRRPRQNAAQLRVEEADQTAVASLGARMGNAVEVLGRLAYLAGKRELVAANLATAQRLRDSEKVRLDNKDLSPLELGRIELEAHELEVQLTRTDAELAGAVAACSATMVAPCAAAGLDASALEAAAPLPGSLPEPGPAIARRPVREASRLEAEALGWDATLAHNRRIPDVTVGVGYTLDNLVVSGDQHQSLAFTVGIPLPLFDRGDHDAAAARASARAIAAEDRAAVQEARGLVEALLGQHRALARALQALEADAVPRSAQIIEQTRKAFDLGEARLADLLLVERAHRDLLVEVLDTRFALFEVRAQLRQALGLDDEIARSLGRRLP